MADDYYVNPLDIPSSTVLITGGSNGIGFGLAQCFVQAGAKVIITSRREQKLKEAIEKLNSIGKQEAIYRVTDIEQVDQRLALYDWITHEHPETNILINNAGIQQRHPFIPNEIASENISWDEREKEIQINLCAPIHLCHLFINHFRHMKTTTAIFNVSSGLAFTPLALIPIYSATKAALHSFTMSLRYQFKNEISNIQVYEIVPPAVQTNLGGSHAFGEPLDEYCTGIFEYIQNGKQEIGYKRSDIVRKMNSREESDKHFISLNDNFKHMFDIKKY